MVSTSPESVRLRPDSRRFGHPRRSKVSLFFIFLALAILVGVFGGMYVQHVSETGEAEVARNLSAIADLKIQQIVNWRGERMGDANIIQAVPSFSDLVELGLYSPSGEDARREIRSWLENLCNQYRYHSAVLLDRSLGARVWAGRGSLQQGDSCVQWVRKAIARGEPLFADLHFTADSALVHMSVITPIYSHRQRSRNRIEHFDSSGARGSLLGCVVLIIDPAQFLYPLVQTFPMASRTAETLLVEADGTDVVFLNELRHRRQTALRLRMPQSTMTLPAAIAVQGSLTVMHGIDYRGMPVVAALRAVPQSPWFMVAKVDRDDIYSGLYQEVRTVVVALSLLLCAGVLAMLVIWHRRETRFLLEQLGLEQENLVMTGRVDSLMKGANDAILVLDDSLRILEVNDKATAMYGYSGAEMCALTLGDIRAPSTRAALQDDLRNADIGALFETVHCRKDGTEFPVETSVRMMETGGAVLRLAIVRDITERKSAKDAMEKTVRELERSNKELEQFAYVASHDLQEPLRMVSSYTQLLASRYGDRLDQDAHEFIEYAVDGAHRMQKLVRDLLTFSRVTTRGRSFTRVDAHEALGEALLNLQLAIQDAEGIVTADRLPAVLADRTQLVQVFQNLIDNALKFRKPGVPPRVRVSCQPHPSTAAGTPPALHGESGRIVWTFSVRDNGVGIEPRHFERIFEIFQRLQDRQSHPGTGIGLAFCKRVIDRHGGTIWVESTPESGSVFYFTLPGFAHVTKGDAEWTQ